MRVLVAMSGGVDSSVVAGLLARAGHEVIGVTLQLYDHGASSSRRGACCAGQDIFDARRVADTLGIAHYVIDAQVRFASAVVDAFAADYAAGETPVPCVRCNQTVKFADLTALADDLGADRLATGHYVRRIDGANGPELHRAADAQRDQSWFLFATTRAQLARSMFPLGDMPDKAEVRAEAARLCLAVADKPDSQDICFVPNGNYASIVGARHPGALAAGEIVTGDGSVVGRHDGIARFTVGQTRGLGDASWVGGARQVVVGSDPARRRIVIGPREGSGARAVSLREANWLVDAPAGDLRCTVKLRGRDVFRPATVRARGIDGADVTLDDPALAAPGQACVFYDGGRVLGGGFATRAATVDAAMPRRVSAALPDRMAV